MRGYASEVQAEADLKQQFAKDWDKGQKLIKSGNSNIQNGNKRVQSAEQDLEKAKDQIEQGNKELAEGTKMVLDSEQGFREAFPDLILNSSK